MCAEKMMGGQLNGTVNRKSSKNAILYSCFVIRHHHGSLSAIQATVPFSIRLSSHCICGRGADSNLQAFPQPCESRQPQHGRYCGLNINVPRTSNGLYGSCNLILAHSHREIMTATVLYGELWHHFTNRKPTYLLVYVHNAYHLFERDNNSQNCAYFN